MQWKLHSRVSNDHHDLISTQHLESFDPGRPNDQTVMLTGLSPGTWHDLLVNAYNEAGRSQASYVFGTLTVDGAYPAQDASDYALSGQIAIDSSTGAAGIEIWNSFMHAMQYSPAILGLTLVLLLTSLFVYMIWIKIKLNESARKTTASRLRNCDCQPISSSKSGYVDDSPNATFNPATELDRLPLSDAGNNYCYKPKLNDGNDQLISNETLNQSVDSSCAIGIYERNGNTAATYGPIGSVLIDPHLHMIQQHAAHQRAPSHVYDIPQQRTFLTANSRSQYDLPQTVSVCKTQSN